MVSQKECQLFLLGRRELLNKQFFNVTFYFLFLASIFSINNSSAQDVGKKPTWVLDFSTSNVDFYHSLVECDGKKAVLLKFDNKNDYSVKVSWKEVFKTQVENEAAGFAGRKELVIPKGITMPASCSDARNKKNITLSTEVNPTYIAEIIEFNYRDIAVSPVTNP